MKLNSAMTLLEKSGVLLVQEALTGELITEPLNENISPDALEAHVKYIEDNDINTSMIFIFNDKVFETHSAILRYNGHWIFWHGYECKFMTWNWQKDIDEIIASYDSEGENEDMNSGWEIYSDNSYDFFEFDFETVEETFLEALNGFAATLNQKSLGSITN